MIGDLAGAFAALCFALSAVVALAVVAYCARKGWADWRRLRREAQLQEFGELLAGDLEERRRWRGRP